MTTTDLRKELGAEDVVPDLFLHAVLASGHDREMGAMARELLRYRTHALAASAESAEVVANMTVYSGSASNSANIMYVHSEMLRMKPGEYRLIVHPDDRAAAKEGSE